MGFQDPHLLETKRKLKIQIITSCGMASIVLGTLRYVQIYTYIYICVNINL